METDEEGEVGKCGIGTSGQGDLEESVGLDERVPGGVRVWDLEKPEEGGIWRREGGSPWSNGLEFWLSIDSILSSNVNVISFFHFISDFAISPISIDFFRYYFVFVI